jgi:hypothetical protein
LSEIKITTKKCKFIESDGRIRKAGSNGDITYSISGTQIGHSSLSPVAVQLAKLFLGVHFTGFLGQLNRDLMDW